MSWLPKCSWPRVVQDLVKAETIHITRQIDAIRGAIPSEEFTTQAVAGSITLQAPTTYGRKLNHTYGFGMFSPVTKDDLSAVEGAYHVSGLQPELDMCEYADASAFKLLEEGYRITGLISHFVCDLRKRKIEGKEQGGNLKDEVEVSEAAGLHDFVAASVQGFASNGRSAELLTVLARSAADREDTRLFYATICGDLVGTAGMAVIDLGHTKISNLFIDSTQPMARGIGVHRALILARLQAAKDAGCEFAMASARKDSISASNIRKAGFELAYECRTYTKLSVLRSSSCSTNSQPVEV